MTISLRSGVDVRVSSLFSNWIARSLSQPRVDSRWGRRECSRVSAEGIESGRASARVLNRNHPRIPVFSDCVFACPSNSPTDSTRLLRSDFFLSIVDFVLELLGWAGILGGAAIAAAGVVAYGNEKGWWDRLIESSGQSDKRFPMVRGLSSSAVFLLVLLFFFLPVGRGSYIRAGLAVVGLLCLLAYVFLTLSSAASELGVGIGELEEAGLEIGWKIGFWLSLLALVVVIVLQFIPMPSANEETTHGEDSDTSL